MSNPTDGNDSTEKDLSEDELDTVAGGAFDTYLQEGPSLGHPITGVSVSSACLNPQPLPP